MKKLLRLFMLATSLSMLLAASCEREPLPDGTFIGYDDMTIKSFIIADIPAAGGVVTPVVEYQYKALYKKGKVINEEIHTDGATVSFEVFDENLNVDKANKTIFAGINEHTTEMFYAVKAVVFCGDARAETETKVKQLASPEGIVSSETVRLPLALLPHDCVDRFDLQGQGLDTKEIHYESANADGIVTMADNIAGYGNMGDYETVSVSGAEIGVTGGQIVRIDTYRSGKVDTVVVEEPVFEVKTTYKVFNYGDTEYVSGKTSPDTHMDPPASSFKDGKWTIAKVGVGAKIMDLDKAKGIPMYDLYRSIGKFTDIQHTLTATAGGETQTIILRQKENDKIGETDKYIEIVNFLAAEVRGFYPLPNIEDFPPGSKPKWLKDYEVFNKDFYDNYNSKLRFFGGSPDIYDDVWYSFEYTKDLHPDGNRQVTIQNVCDVMWHKPQNIYLTRDKSELLVTEAELVRQIPYAKVTATANVKKKNGEIENIKHVYEWTIDLHFNKTFFDINLPVIEDAAEDFQWTFKYEWQYYRPGKNDGLIPQGDGTGHMSQGTQADFSLADDEIDKYSNFNEFDWPEYLEFTIWDRRKLCWEWAEEAKISGFVLPMDNEESDYLPHIIDGVPQVDNNGNYMDGRPN